jgi:hypothetical protein
MRSIEAVLVLSFAPFTLLGLPSCGSAPPPPAAVAGAEDRIRSARELLGADADPQGRLHLRLAQEELDKAKKLIADGDGRSADLVLSRAAADAELALAEAHEAQARAKAQQAQDQVIFKAAQH